MNRRAGKNAGTPETNIETLNRHLSSREEALTKRRWCAACSCFALSEGGRVVLIQRGKIRQWRCKACLKLRPHLLVKESKEQTL